MRGADNEYRGTAFVAAPNQSPGRSQQRAGRAGSERVGTMIGRSHIRWTLWTLYPAALTLASMLSVSPFAAQPQKPASQADLPAAALKDFQQRLKGYMDLRADLTRKLKPLSPTASASELAARQESLAAALRQTRKTAKQGDLIPTPVASQLRTVVRTDLQNRSAESRQAAFSEVANATAPIINRTYPANAALPTMPPLLLAKLPMLPHNLQYRFLGRHLLLLDGDTQLILDYVSNVLPPH